MQPAFTSKQAPRSHVDAAIVVSACRAEVHDWKAGISAMLQDPIPEIAGWLILISILIVHYCSKTKNRVEDVIYGDLV
jgi:hypothetical protein